jgi:outer membrane protein
MPAKQMPLQGLQCRRAQALHKHARASPSESCTPTLATLAMIRSAAFALAALAVAMPAQSADLLQVFRDARAFDAGYASARAALEAGREKLPQGRALILPAINATANTVQSDNHVLFRQPSGGVPANNPVTRNFNTSAWTVTLSQPLYRKQNSIQYEQAGYQVLQSEAQFGQATQDLIVRVAQAYFDVLAAENSLAFIGAQKTAITEQLAQAKRNFEVGTATITDTNEAQARFDLAVSQEIASQNDLEIRRRILQQIVGAFPETLTPLRSSFTLSPPQPNRMEEWVQAAQKDSYAVHIQESATEIAQREVERNRAGHLPTLDLVATYGNILTGSNTTNGVGSDVRSGTLGLQFALPLYSGGGVDSRVREAIANLDKARSDLENTRRQAALSARQSFLGVTNGIAQVRALEQAVTSSETALASNKLGYEVGVRINIDVLNAQQQVYSTKRDLAQARYNTIMNGLKLKAASGSLSEEDMETVNQLLGGN